MAVCMQAADVLNFRVNCAHVLQAPQSRTYDLLDGVHFDISGAMPRLNFNREKDREQRESNSLGVVLNLVHIRHT